MLFRSQSGALARAPRTDLVYRTVRKQIPHYRDDRPLAADIERARDLIHGPVAVDFGGHEPVAKETGSYMLRPPSTAMIWPVT